MGVYSINKKPTAPCLDAVCGRKGAKLLRHFLVVVIYSDEADYVHDFSIDSFRRDDAYRQLHSSVVGFHNHVRCIFCITIEDGGG